MRFFKIRRNDWIIEFEVVEVDKAMDRKLATFIGYSELTMGAMGELMPSFLASAEKELNERLDNQKLEEAMHG